MDTELADESTRAGVAEFVSKRAVSPRLRNGASEPGFDLPEDVEEVEVEETLHFDLKTAKTKRESDHLEYEVGKHKMYKYSLYETKARYYLVGGDLADQNFRILKVDRTAPPGQLHLVEDDTIYTKRQMNDLLTTIEQGNPVGGMKHRGNSWGLLGFIRFTEAFYMLMVTKKQPIAMIGGHYIYQVEGTELIPLSTGPSKYQSNRNPEEQRFLNILHNLDLHRCFYFSNSYNITRTLQENIIRARNTPKCPDIGVQGQGFNEMFVWNHHLLDPAIGSLKRPYDWCTPIIHGFVDQSSVDVFGKSVWVTLIARRSRFFAGARFLKRGANDLGYVANDVETEQIVSELQLTSLDAPGNRIHENPSHTSFVQHRGSIPLYWTQDNTGVTPKPGIELNFIDPFYSAAALHFDNLFERYGAPITVLNLVRSRERTPREVKLLVEYQNAVAYLNQPLPEEKKIRYRAFDMARAAKSRDQDVIASLEKIAEEVVRSTGFFHNGNVRHGDIPSVQNGVTRSNCIDCLDRTNACQFVIGKIAFSYQLQALGIIAGNHVNYDSDATNMLAHMYNDHGDTLASQYGGSHLVNTTDSYRKLGNWQSHSRDMLESFKRYYHNSFLDSQRQEAYNLFLGNYRYASGQPMLWDLPTDYYLHHASPSTFAELNRRDYVHWYTPEYLKERTLPATKPRRKCPGKTAFESEWWREYYKPDQYSAFNKAFAFRMNSNTTYLSKTTSYLLDRSPFTVRRHDEPKHVQSDDCKVNPLSATAPPVSDARRITSLQQWLNTSPETPRHDPKAEFAPADKALMKQWTMRQFYDNALHPSITAEEEAYYQKSSEKVTAEDIAENVDMDEDVNDAYVHSVSISEHTLAGKVEYQRWATEENPLIVRADDYEKKRFQAYGKWLKGKSLFKQFKVDPEYA